MPVDPEPVPLFQSERLSCFGNRDGTVDLLLHLSGEAEPRVVELPHAAVHAIAEFCGGAEPDETADAWACSAADLAAFVAEGYRLGLRDRGTVRA